jgi:hypothetical protein
MPPAKVALNLGGEGEIPDVINQQGPWALAPSWRSSRHGKTLQELVNDGHVFLIAPNTPLPFPDNSVDLVYTESVPIDTTTWLGPGVQSSEIMRILKQGGQWIDNGVVRWTKP